MADAVPADAKDFRVLSQRVARVERQVATLAQESRDSTTAITQRLDGMNGSLAAAKAIDKKFDQETVSHLLELSSRVEAVLGLADRAARREIFWSELKTLWKGGIAVIAALGTLSMLIYYGGALLARH